MVLCSCTSPNSSLMDCRFHSFSTYGLRIASNERTINSEKVVVVSIAYYSNSTACKNDP